MKRFKAELYCHIVATMDLEVEADSPEEARDRAIEDAKKLSICDWDLQEVEDIDLNTLHLPEAITGDEQ